VGHGRWEAPRGRDVHEACDVSARKPRPEIGPPPRYNDESMDLSRTPLRSNLELKARIDDPDRCLRVCRAIGAVDEGERRQVDTYFTLGRHRLKLRENSMGESFLIGYSRPDLADARKSQYRVAPVKAARTVKMLLTRQWGVKAVVTKSRHVFLWQGRVRIHIDRVEELGDYLEFECVLDAEHGGYDEDAARLDLARLRHDFGVRQADLIDGSYANLLLQGAATPTGT